MITSNSQSSVLSRNFWLLSTLNFCIYIALLVGRGWGAHRMLHYEETIAVASALSQNLFLSLNDWAYGILIPRVLIQIAVQFPLEYLPMVLFTMATVLWAIYSLIIFIVVYKMTQRYFTSTLTSLVLILVPLPELGMQGVVWNSFWPMFIALGVVVGFRAYGESKRLNYLVTLFAFFTAASNPITGVLIVLIGVDIIWKKNLRSRASIVGVGLLFGMLFSLYVQINQQPPLRYLGEWTQELAQTSETLGRLEDSGAARIRTAPAIDIVQVVKGLPGTVKYLLTQMAPEPYASRWVLSSDAMSNVLRTGTLFLIFVVAPCAYLILMFRQGSATFRIESLYPLRMFVLASLVLLLQVFLISGTLQTRQLLFAPICFYWIGLFLLVSKKLKFKKYAVELSYPFVCALTLIFASTGFQNFRDPFDAEPRQGGMGRYEDNWLWSKALDTARNSCSKMSPEEIVIISQKDEIWQDAPVVVRCKFIEK